MPSEDIFSFNIFQTHGHKDIMIYAINNSSNHTSLDLLDLIVLETIYLDIIPLEFSLKSVKEAKA